MEHHVLMRNPRKYNMCCADLKHRRAACSRTATAENGTHAKQDPGHQKADSGSWALPAKHMLKRCPSSPAQRTRQGTSRENRSAAAASFKIKENGDLWDILEVPNSPGLPPSVRLRPLFQDLWVHAPGKGFGPVCSGQCSRTSLAVHRS